MASPAFAIFFCGHDHVGGYRAIGQNLHFVTLEALLEGAVQGDCSCRWDTAVLDMNISCSSCLRRVHVVLPTGTCSEEPGKVWCMPHCMRVNVSTLVLSTYLITPEGPGCHVDALDVPTAATSDLRPQCEMTPGCETATVN